MANAPLMLREQCCTTLGVDDGEEDAQKHRFKSDKEGENFKQKGHDGKDSAQGRGAEKIQICCEESTGQEADR
jgi:hypothetical protein